MWNKLSETTPKDRDRILVFNAISGGYSVRITHDGCIGLKHTDYEYIYWMPLPEPPINPSEIVNNKARAKQSEIEMLKARVSEMEAIIKDIKKGEGDGDAKE